MSPTPPPKEKKVELSFTNWVLGGSLLSINSSQTTGVSKRVRKVVVGQDGAKAVVEKPKDTIIVEVKKDSKKDEPAKPAEPAAAAPEPAPIKEDKPSDAKSTHPTIATTAAREWATEQDEKIRSMKAENKSWKEISQVLSIPRKDIVARWKVLSAEKKDDAVTETVTETPVEEVVEMEFGALASEDLNFGCGDWGVEDSNFTPGPAEDSTDRPVAEMSGALNAWGVPMSTPDINNDDGGATSAWSGPVDTNNDSNQNYSGGGIGWGATAAQKDNGKGQGGGKDKNKGSKKPKKQKGGGGSGGNNQDSNNSQTENQDRGGNSGWDGQQTQNVDMNQNQSQDFSTSNNNNNNSNGTFSPAKSYSSPHSPHHATFSKTHLSSANSTPLSSPCACPDCLLKDVPPKSGRLRPDNIWSREDCEILEELEKRYRENKWLEIQAAFFNWTGRMVEGEIIERKFRGDGFI
ncbi:hypothetical protein BGZ60DRAFT_551845 [Tricladium varicosporioides]|nr:hypothetical protein BGZ60DRAFT_551845 [Hymenoscyphus varicosporioides]